MYQRGSNRNFNSFNKRGGGGRGGWRGARGSFRGSHSRGGGFGGYRGGGRGDQNFGNRSQNQQWNSRPKRDSPGKRLSEEEIGVTEYLSDHEGFTGIIKSRYSDFQVSEINEQGEIAVLTDLNPPAVPAEEMVDQDEDLLLNKYNPEILPMETWDKINTLVMSENNTDKVEVDVSGMTKEQRTKIHDAVKKAFGNTIVGSTVTQGDKKFVKFERYRKGVRVDNRVKWIWPGEYVHFIVYKENCDTMDAAVQIAERLRLNIKPSMLGYAGTKDRRAKTSQWFSLRKVDPRRVASACRHLRDLRLGNYAFRDYHLRLGMLRGNRFRIALRNVTAPEHVVETACQRLKERGFINYYGLQRFGSRVGTPTYEIGLKLLQGNYKEAIASILEEREGPLEEALRVYAREGAEAALRAWPRRAPHAQIELRLVRALAAQPRDLLGALYKMARNTRLLYLHSYQSLVWNRCVSERLRRHGLQPAAGDLVPLADLREEEVPIEADEEDNDDPETQDGDAKQDGDDNEMADDKDKTEVSKNNLESSIKQEKQKVPVKILTQEDVDSGKYTLFDIVLPLPGYMIEYPPNMKDYYEELLSKDGLNLEMKHKLKTYTMSGAYRHVAARAGALEWRRARYSDPCADLILSDRDRLEGRTLTGLLEDGKYRALLLTMTLPSSCYATMALRELLKMDTSCDVQAAQNNYHKEPTNVKNEETKTSSEVTKGSSEVTKGSSEVTKGSSEATKGSSKATKGSSEETKESCDTIDSSEEIKNGVKEETSVGDKRKLEEDDEVNVKKLKQELEQ